MCNLELAPHDPRERKIFRLTCLAQKRTDGRGFRLQAIRAAREFGHVIRVRGAEIYIIGRKQLLRYRRHGVDLRDYEGIQVVCPPGIALVLTAYRNRDFRGLRPSIRNPSPVRLPMPSVGDETLPVTM